MTVRMSIWVRWTEPSPHGVRGAMFDENGSLSYDLLVSEAHRTDWRTRQAAIWADALHETLLKSVAY